MNADYAAALAQWDTFFSVAAGVSATLIGLLFVGLAINPAIMADDAPAGLREWSGQTFHSFLMVLTISMLGVLPVDTGEVLAIALVIIGVTGVLGVARAIRVAQTDPDPSWRLRGAIGRFALPLVAYGLCLWAAYLTWQDDIDAMGWLVTAIFFLTMSAAASCWDLLKVLGNPKQGSAPTPGSGA
jgi:hypothetical protein